MADYDKEQWQEQERAREDAQSAFRDKMAKSRQRSANNAKRKIARLHAKLTELGHISEFEDEFGESVLERLEKYGSAFHDPEKGRAGDALSLAQRQVVNRMNKKVKELKAKQRPQNYPESTRLEDTEDDFQGDYVRTGWSSKQDKGGSAKSSFRQKSGFKRTSKFTPRVRQLDDDFEAPASNTPKFDRSHEPDRDTDQDTNQDTQIDRTGASLPVFDETVRPFLPQYKPEEAYRKTGKSSVSKPSTQPPAKPKPTQKPFLRLVSSD